MLGAHLSSWTDRSKEEGKLAPLWVREKASFLRRLEGLYFFLFSGPLILGPVVYSGDMVGKPCLVASPLIIGAVLCGSCRCGQETGAQGSCRICVRSLGNGRFMVELCLGCAGLGPPSVVCCVDIAGTLSTEE